MAHTRVCNAEQILKFNVNLISWECPPPSSKLQQVFNLKEDFWNCRKIERNQIILNLLTLFTVFILVA